MKRELQGHQIYLPFIGMLIDENKRHAVKTCFRISFLTQKLLLRAPYQSWNRANVTKAAELLGVSKMSITRCFDELEDLDVSYLTIRSRARNIIADPDKKAMWEQIRLNLRNPAIAVYTLNKGPNIEPPMAGMMELFYYSMLDEGRYPMIFTALPGMKESGRKLRAVKNLHTRKSLSSVWRFTQSLGHFP